MKFLNEYSMSYGQVSIPAPDAKQFIKYITVRTRIQEKKYASHVILCVKASVCVGGFIN